MLNDVLCMPTDFRFFKVFYNLNFGLSAPSSRGKTSASANRALRQHHSAGGSERINFGRRCGRRSSLMSLTCFQGW